MAMLVWVMMGIAVWHFTVFVPDRFWGGIVGAFLVAVVSSIFFGLIINAGGVPGQSDTDITQALIAIPGSVLGLAASWFYGASYDERHGLDHGHTREGSL